MSRLLDGLLSRNDRDVGNDNEKGENDKERAGSDRCTIQCMYLRDFVLANGIASMPPTRRGRNTTNICTPLYPCFTHLRSLARLATSSLIRLHYYLPTYPLTYLPTHRFSDTNTVSWMLSFIYLIYLIHGAAHRRVSIDEFFYDIGRGQEDGNGSSWEHSQRIHILDGSTTDDARDRIRR